MHTDQAFSASRTKMNRRHGKYMVVMYTKQADCGGRCRYCIKDQHVTSSTIPNEDTLLAQQTKYSSSLQLINRCKAEGVELDCGNKFELRIKGNSFTNYSPIYLERYIKEVYDLLNQEPSKTFEEAFLKQEFSNDKCVQIVVETRPDQITPEWCEIMQHLGITTVEIGVQSLFDDVLDANWRGHSVEAVCNATSLIRKYGFELGYQVMLGLFGSTYEKDFLMISHLLWQEKYYPDTLKMYPCVLLPNRAAQASLYDLYDNDKWKPIINEEYENFLRQVSPYFPPDVHVNRLQRIFSSQEVAFGVKYEINRQEFRNLSRCMWQRSIQNNNPESLTNIQLEKYRIIVFTHGSDKCFQAVTENNIILGYGRLSIQDTYGVVRDLRVLGEPAKVGEHLDDPLFIQHRGIGTAILWQMEALLANLGLKKIFVYSSAGSVAYFKKKGYKTVNHYTLFKYLDGEG